MAIIVLLDYNLSFKVLHAVGRTAGLVKIMPLVAPTDQLKLDRADLSVEARCGNNIHKTIIPHLKGMFYLGLKIMKQLL